ncbi:MAG: MarR family winged helix-turn-helix transcriptional regulator [Mycobacteriales bacterium]|nr:MAG: MarR family transcriptional regulator [Pseudonocardiales bacterium]
MTRAETRTSGGLAGALRLSVVRLNRRLRSQRADTSVTLTQVAALSTLRHHGRMSPGALAAHEKVQPPSMTRVLAALEERGLVTRRAHPHDRRQAIVELTDVGTKIVDEEVRAREAWLCQRIQGIPEQDRQTLRAAVEVINRIVES